MLLVIRNLVNLLGAAGPILFIALTAIAHIIVRGYNWISQTISELALSSDGWLETAALSILGISVGALAVTLYFGLPRTKVTRVAFILLIVIGLALLLTGVFPTNNLNDGVNAPALIHSWAVRLIAVLFPVVCFLLAYAFRSDSRLKVIYPYTVVAGAIGLALDFMSLAFPLESLHYYVGIYERILAINGLVWFEVVAIKVLLVSKPDQKTALPILSAQDGASDSK